MISTRHNFNLTGTMLRFL